MDVAASGNVSVLVAALGLKEVQLLVGAMRAADQAARRASALPGPPNEPVVARPAVAPEPRYLPRRVIHPEPRYAPRPVEHPTPRLGTGPAPCPTEGNPPPVIVIVKPPNECPLAPPWRTPAWQQPLPPAPSIKVAPPRPDIIHKGMLLDVFI